MPGPPPSATQGRAWWRQCVPGPSSVTTALSVAGIEIANTQEGGFVFAGFLPSRPTERNARIALLAAEPRAIVLLEAPHRIEALAAAVSSLGQRRLTVGRELTKQFEEIATLAAADLVSWLNADSNRSRGEFVLVLHPEVVPPQAGGEERVLKLLLAELPLKTAVKLAADITGASRNVLYQSALAQKNAGPEEPG
jgi:16S rRNA (cytidine1402-2'-O)-methyltransferase